MVSGTCGPTDFQLNAIRCTGKWPTNEKGERVAPSDLEVYQASHNMLGPCCLRPIQKQGGWISWNRRRVGGTRNKFDGKGSRRISRRGGRGTSCHGKIYGG